MRSVLISALVGYTAPPARAKSRRFLQGLSADELQFIAEYLGACILEAADGQERGESGLRLSRFQAAHEYDAEHKAILLLEFMRAFRGQRSAVS